MMRREFRLVTVEAFKRWSVEAEDRRGEEFSTEGNEVNEGFLKKNSGLRFLRYLL
jgi:hypothetical protein